jgi:Icc protein
VDRTVTEVAPRRAEVTTVADDEIVVHVSTGDGRAEVVRLAGLEQSTEYQLEGLTARTLERPPGELLCRFATVNDVHFGEKVCGSVADFGDLLRFFSASGADPTEVDAAATRASAAFEQFGSSSVLTSDDLTMVDEGGHSTYLELMSAAAAGEMAAIEPAVVLAKGDLTGKGTAEEYEAFLSCYEQAFGDRLLHVRGNHDAMSGVEIATGPRSVEVPGATLALLDTVIEGRDSGQLPDEQLAWLDDLAGSAGGPLLVFGHHHAWNPASKTRSPTYFGINPDDSEALVSLVRTYPPENERTP